MAYQTLNVNPRNLSLVEMRRRMTLAKEKLEQIRTLTPNEQFAVRQLFYKDTETKEQLVERVQRVLIRLSIEDTKYCNILVQNLPRRNK